MSEDFNLNAEEQEFESELPELPHRGYVTGTFVDGKTTSKTYLCIAVRKDEDVYNCVGIRKMGENWFKYHYWPSDEFFGVTAPDRYESDHSGMSKGDYVGGESDWDGVVAQLEALAMKEGTSVAVADKILGAFNLKYPTPRGKTPNLEEDGHDDY